MCVTPETVKAALTPRTKAVIAVHLFGNVAPIAEIEALGVPVLEDAAQAAGSTGPAGRPGALGTIATFSFYPSKNLGAFGDGGAITTNDAALADARAHAALPRLAGQGHLHAGRLQQPPRRAAGRGPARRAARARPLGRRIATTSASGTPRRASASWRRCRRRPTARAPRGTSTSSATSAPTSSRRRSPRRDVDSSGYYRTPVHRQPAMAEWGAGVELPFTDELARTHLALPISAALTRDQVDEVVGAVRDARLD